MIIKTAKLVKRGKSFVLNYQDFEGRQIRKSVGSDPRIASKILVRANEFLLEGKDPWTELEKERTKAGCQYTLETLFPVFLERHGKYQSPRTQEKYNARFVQICSKPIAQKPISEITKAELYAYGDARIEDDKVSGSTVNIEVKMIKTMLGFAKERGYIANHQVDSLKYYKEPKPYRVSITPEKLQEFMGSLPEHIARIVEFAIYTGLRKENILGLRIEQVDFDNRIVSVNTKGNVDEGYPLSENAVEVLKQAIGDRKEGYVFTTKTGQRYFRTLSSFTRCVREMDLRVGNGKYFRFHDLRHIFGTWLILNGVPTKFVSELMGHANEKTTERYTVIGMSDAAKHINKIPRIERPVVEKPKKKEKKKKAPK